MKYQNFYDIVSKHFYMILVILISILISIIFFKFWIGGHILEHVADAEMYKYSFYLRERTASLDRLIPTRLGDFLPGNNVVVTFNLFIPFFLLLESYSFIILLQVLSISSSIPIFYLLSKEYLSKFKSLLLTVIYSTSPLLIFAGFLKGFKPCITYFPFIFLMFYGYKKNNYKLFLFSSIFLVLTKQIFMPILITFSIYILWKRGNRKYFLTAFLIGLVSLSIYALLLLKFPSIRDVITSDYGQGPSNLLLNPLPLLERMTNNTIVFTRILPYLFFIPLIAPEILFVASPKILDFLAIGVLFRFRDELRLLLPFLFIATLFGFHRIRKILAKFLSKITVSKILIIIMILMISANIYSIHKEKHLVLSSTGGYYPTLNYNTDSCQFDEELSLKKKAEAARWLISKIPDDSRVLSSHNLKLFLFEDGHQISNSIDSADYILWDKCLENCSDQDCLNHYKVKVESYEGFREVNERKNISLMKRIEGDFL